MSMRADDDLDLPSGVTRQELEALKHEAGHCLNDSLFKKLNEIEQVKNVLISSFGFALNSVAFVGMLAFSLKVINFVINFYLVFGCAVLFKAEEPLRIYGSFGAAYQETVDATHCSVIAAGCSRMFVVTSAAFVQKAMSI